mmetsp:Transcript_49601/g.105559  ORF Transcript_49601/g.105559 Transcript_49601/m.105559 type:complete len:380 (-) Transcript_49601:63-1202(-)
MAQRTPHATIAWDEDGHFKHANQYNFISECGQGTFCKVKWAEDKEKTPFALKVFSRGVLDRHQVSLFTRDGVTTIPLKDRIEEEIRLLASLQHPHIMPLIEVIDDPSKEHMFMVLEGLAGGQIMSWHDDLAAYTMVPQSTFSPPISDAWGASVRCLQSASPSTSPTVFQEAAAAHLFQKILSGVEYMHSKRIVHKDLKPDNIMLTRPLPYQDGRFARELSIVGWPNLQGPQPIAIEMQDPLTTLFQKFPVEPKIGDFNSAVQCSDEDCTIYDAEGTHHFTPPECFDPHDDGLKGCPRDVWSLGCLLFVMLFGRCPYWEKQSIMLQLSIMSDPLVVPDNVISDVAKDLICQLMHRSPNERCNIPAALSHKFFGAKTANEA